MPGISKEPCIRHREGEKENDFFSSFNAWSSLRHKYQSERAFPFTRRCSLTHPTLQWWLFYKTAVQGNPCIERFFQSLIPRWFERKKGRDITKEFFICFVYGLIFGTHNDIVWIKKKTMRNNLIKSQTLRFISNLCPRYTLKNCDLLSPVYFLGVTIKSKRDAPCSLQKSSIALTQFRTLLDG